LSFGASVFGALFSRKKLSVTNINKATTAARSAGRAYKESKDVSRAEEDLDSLVEQKKKLEAEFQEETKRLEAKIDPQTEELQSVALKPKKTNISVRLVALAWQA
jgi:Skp family chaperone for outer membrane proteins